MAVLPRESGASSIPVTAVREPKRRAGSPAGACPRAALRADRGRAITVVRATDAVIARQRVRAQRGPMTAPRNPSHGAPASGVVVGFAALYPPYDSTIRTWARVSPAVRTLHGEFAHAKIRLKS